MRTIPLIVDTDPGLDDALALAVLAGSPEIQVLAACAVGGNVPLKQTARNLDGLMRLFGLVNAPVLRGWDPHRGLNAPEVHGGDGLANFAKKLPTPPRTLRSSTQLEKMLAQAADQSVHLLTLGPLTNLARLFKRAPKLLKRKLKQITVMGGGLSDPGNVAPLIEFNVACDPRACDEVLCAGLPLRIVPLDVTHKLTLSNAHAAQLARTGTPVGRALAHFIRGLVQFQDYIGPAAADGLFGRGKKGGHGIVHDALAACAVLRLDFFTWELLPLRVESRGELTSGQMLSDRRPGRHRNSGWPRSLVAVDVKVTAARNWIMRRMLTTARRA
jgi:purine nucleosidase